MQFALNPDSFEYAVIEVNPRVSRSSALASKATGYPIAKVAAKIALGYTLDEIPNAVTGKTTACFEPTLDYCVLKIPRLPFDKFTTASRTLGTQMKATGEVMAIANSFEGALMKAIRSLELNVRALKLDKLEGLYTDEIEDLLVQVTDERLFVVAEALRRGFSPQKINHITKMDIWFLDGFQRIIDMEDELERCKGEPDIDTLKRAKEMCFADSYIGTLCGMKQAEVKALRERYGIIPSFKMVDTCAAEFDAETPYYYSTYDGENEAVETGSGKKKVLVLGSGPIRIGQGIEFDYCSVHSVWAFKRMGYETIIINNNPETVSTDFDVADKLYFEPLTAEDVQNIVEQEKPWGAVVQFGGQTAIKLAKALTEMGVQILGTSADGVDAAEDRERFDEILEKCGIPRAKGRTVFTTQEALPGGQRVGLPRAGPSLLRAGRPGHGDRLLRPEHRGVHADHQPDRSGAPHPHRQVPDGPGAGGGRRVRRGGHPHPRHHGACGAGRRPLRRLHRGLSPPPPGGQAPGADPEAHQEHGQAPGRHWPDQRPVYPL